MAKGFKPSMANITMEVVQKDKLGQNSLELVLRGKISDLEKQHGIMHKKIAHIIDTLGSSRMLLVLETAIEASKSYENLSERNIELNFDALRELYNAHYMGIVLKKSGKDYDDISKAVVSLLMDFEEMVDAGYALSLSAYIVQQAARIPKEDRFRIERRANSFKKVFENELRKYG
ncbi:MAG: hypothetical protein ACREBF_03985 [Candidatus Micrarchaeales archaeon]